MTGIHLHRLRRSTGAGVLLLTACYTQVPLEAPAPAPAARIIASLTDTGTVVMANTVGPGASAIEGIVTSADANTWTLNLLRVDHLGGTSVAWNREVVSFPRYALTRPEVKRLDKTRSWGAAVLVGAAAFVATRLFSHAGSDDPGTPPPPPPANRVPGGH
jgi:hypothetical protein